MIRDHLVRSFAKSIREFGFNIEENLELLSI
jgi:hypothetical protein